MMELLSHSVHDPSIGKLASLIFGRSRAVQEGCAGTNQDQAAVFLLRRDGLTILLDKVV